MEDMKDAKINQVLGILDTQAKDIRDIKEALNQIAIQGERINELSRKTSALFKKYDQAFSVDGTISKIISFQSSCPRDKIEKSTEELKEKIKEDFNNATTQTDKDLGKIWKAIYVMITIFLAQTAFLAKLAFFK